MAASKSTQWIMQVIMHTLNKPWGFENMKTIRKYEKNQRLI